MGTTTGLQRIAEGREAEIFAWEDGAVLRLFRERRDDASIDAEYVAMSAARSVVPLVPSVLGRTEVDGRPGLIMERVDGPDLLTLISKRPWWVWRGGTVCGQVQAQLHTVQAPPALPPLKERIRRLVRGPLVPPHVAAFVLRELDALPDGDTLCHGDFHPANILMSDRGPIVIDWPNATRGDATADFARSMLIMDIGAVPPGAPLVIRVGERFARRVLKRAYERAYTRAHPVDPVLIRRWRLVRAADRLADNIPEERAALLAILDDGIAAGSSPEGSQAAGSGK